MENRAGSGGRGVDEESTPRLNARVAGPALAAGAVSLGLVLVGSCGLGQRDVYVTPPPLNAGLQSAPPGGIATKAPGTTGPAVLIPPSPSWRVAVNPPAPRRTLSGVPSTSPGAEPVPPVAGEPARGTEAIDDTAPVTTTTRSTTTRPTTTRPAPTTRRESPSEQEPSSDGSGY
ncbi:hypothetical protein [Nocardia wallacei]|uniref:hypothetical protein n=1 Tax=Nocardia wallacei TaxID=480035 RepID=UPI002455947E|nr:hypothetical protein [Nocardia wallacei]